MICIANKGALVNVVKKNIEICGVFDLKHKKHVIGGRVEFLSWCP